MIYREGRLVSSYTQLDCFINCNYNWYLKYIEKQKSTLRSKHLEYGICVHETLEIYLNMKKNGINVGMPELCEIYEDNFEGRDIPFDTYEEELEAKYKGIEMIQHIYNPVTELDLMIGGNFEILGVEMPIEVEIEMPKDWFYRYVDNDSVVQVIEDRIVTVIGFIDLVIRTEQGIIVIDHKSGKTLYTKEKLNSNLQFPIYAMHILKMFGELPYKCIYNFTRLAKAQEVVIDNNRIEEAKKLITVTLVEMSTLKNDASPSYLCYWCDWGVYNENICKYSSKFKPKVKGV